MTTATASPVDLTEVMPTASPLRAIPIGLLHPNPDNPRADLGDVDELAQSIRENGGRLLQPLVVVPAAIYRDTPAPTDADRFVVIAGHRRLAACQLLDLPDVDCIVRDDLVGPAARIAMLVENLQRVDLTALEEAQAFDALQTLGLSQRDIAGRVGRNQSHISKRLGLLRLSDTGRDLLAAGTLTLDQAVDVAKMPETVQTSVLADIEKGPAYGGVDGVIRAAQAKLTELAERGKAIAGARESGVECLVVDDPNITMQAWRDLLAERNAVKLDNLRYDGTPAHVELPCHLVVIGSRKEWVRTADGYSERWAVPYCTDPDSHATDEAADADPGVDAAERAAERARWEAENAARSEHRERLDALHQRRLDFARTLLAGKLPSGAVEHVLRASVLERVCGVDLYDASEQVSKAGQLLDLPEHDRERAASKTLLAVLDRLRRSKDDALRLALAVRLVADEQELHSLLLHGDHPQAAAAQAHLEFLKHAGYQPDELETLPDDLHPIEHHLDDFGLVDLPPADDDIDGQGDEP